ncbi:lipid-binding SYLF domain-containing protein [Oceanomicrobium pacificus]|uniref:Twin-arginine translocation pathway signal n=1 Tax=Oceanomicrobium pacificus TaxID=2692916 RepID=A0A6B0TPL7_9RHOB|nr:lipid-binding SYLF domain-containing protein [Oceanomicrobium pacificus]MXU65856.1 twin-arginine translocation pathway signal [Oceanomicrobium pacificus]
MTSLTRRTFILAAGATAACSSPPPINSPRVELDSAIMDARKFMFTSVPGSQQLAERSAGYLIMPQVIEAGFMAGGSYGEGGLIIGEAIVDYYSVANVSFGFQVGAQQASHALFFMTQEALQNFRTADGWKLSADATWVIDTTGISFGASSKTLNQPVIALVFNQSGVIAGATLQGGKYSRIVRN